MVSTPLKNISQIGSFPQVGVNILKKWNHHLVAHSQLSCAKLQDWHQIQATTANSDVHKTVCTTRSSCEVPKIQHHHLISHSTYNCPLWLRTLGSALLFHNTTQARLYFVGDWVWGSRISLINVGFTNYSDELMTSVMKNLEQLNPGASLSSCRFVPNKVGTFRPIGDEKEGRLTMTSARGKARTNEPQEPFKIHGSNWHPEHHSPPPFFGWVPPNVNSPGCIDDLEAFCKVPEWPN